MKKCIRLTAASLLIWSGVSHASQDVAPVNSEAYKADCGACHMAYQPGFLPERSWKKLMANLADHFGENAELPADDQQAITQYLVDNAADRSSYKRSKNIMKSLRDSDTPLRITDIDYIKRKHHEVPTRLIKDNPEVKSLSRCEVCHTKADTGSYSEREIHIPGRGRWED